MSGTWWVDEKDLFPEQLEVLSRDLDKDLLLSGPPGSGKTNLLLLRANHLMLTRPDAEFYIICLTSLLKNFVRTGADLYLFPANRIITQRKLLEQVLGDHACLPPRKLGETYAERDIALKSSMQELMKKGAGRGAFPVLFVDEAQDYSDIDLEIFNYLAKNLSCAADLRQGIYESGAAGTPWLEKHPWEAPITLRFHFRVAPAILEVADKIMEGKFGHIPMLGTHQYKGDPGTVEVVVQGVSLDDQISASIPKIVKHLSVYPGQSIGILVPRRRDVEHVVNRLRGAAELGTKVTNAMGKDFEPALPVWVSTVHSSKGLEFRCVHLVAADMLAEFQKYERRVAFTAVTRAKTALAVYHEKPLHPFLASALAKPSTEKIALKNLFGKAS